MQDILIFLKRFHTFPPFPLPNCLRDQSGSESEQATVEIFYTRLILTPAPVGALAHLNKNFHERV